jgi:arginyl-tRNA synthetase
MKENVSNLISSALKSLSRDGMFGEASLPTPQIEHTKDDKHGDLASNIAMVLAKAARKAPRDVAALIIERLPENTVIERCEIAGPGFINFFLSQSTNLAVIEDVLTQGAKFGCNSDGADRPVQVEFVSANPTGPLHVGHGRGAAIGDSLCRLLEASGWRVQREFYYNDAGQQINNLAASVKARLEGKTPDASDWPADGYQGEYIIDVANAFNEGATVVAADRTVKASANTEALDEIKDFAVAWLRREQDEDLKAFGVNFDCYFLESSLYDGGEVEHVVDVLKQHGQTYERDGALWLRTTEHGDDKDRVMKKREGGYTYFVPDVAYHKNKWDRGFTRVINEQGADHHSTITRVRAGLQGLQTGIPEGWPEYVLHQMVTVMRDGAEVKLSKRAGSYVTLRDLIDWVGQDATRFFLSARAATSQLTFDIDLALSKSNENPVYYIQYAHARICSVMEKAKIEIPNWDVRDGIQNLERLTEQEELRLALTLSKYPEVVRSATQKLEPHMIANYLKELAADFHSFYNAHRMMEDDKALATARLALARASQIVIANGLKLLGVSAPKAM